ncbi:39S ribosomal protein L53, mitochondrial [Echinococcus granulosus]|uniref:Large ribosomal subunit protein mL53 n=1 Tax=Echinococcus granulosus TaxID=6210 RepID=A0A068WWB3_ECHGR|nr:39S ribosomal protein L53, mitochondrial [Echinococcus granulosus]CDS24135.1 mitochondrial ribosomal protein l53 [Echinococcus granulosus]
MVGIQKARKLLPIIKYFRSPLALNDLTINRSLLEQINLKPVKSIEFSFSPFFSHTYSIRQVCALLYRPRWRSSNDNCTLKVNVLSDKSQPQIQVTFSNGSVLVIKTANLTDREVLEFIMIECSRNLQT